MAADPGVTYDPGRFEPVCQMRRLEPIDLDPFVTSKRTDPIPVRLRLPSNPAMGLDEELVKLRLPTNPSEEFVEDSFNLRISSGTRLDEGGEQSPWQPMKDSEFWDDKPQKPPIRNDRPQKQPTIRESGGDVVKESDKERGKISKKEDREHRPGSIVLSVKNKKENSKQQKKNIVRSRHDSGSEYERKDRGQPDPIKKSQQQGANKDVRDVPLVEHPVRRASPLAARPRDDSFSRRPDSAHRSRDADTASDNWLSNIESGEPVPVQRTNLVRELRLQRQREKERRDERRKAQQIINCLHGQTDTHSQPDRDPHRQREPQRHREPYKQQDKQGDLFTSVDHSRKNPASGNPARENSRSRNPHRDENPRLSENPGQREKPRPTSESGYRAQSRRGSRSNQWHGPIKGSSNRVNRSGSREGKGNAGRPISAQSLSRIISGLPFEERQRLRAALEEELRLYKL